MAGFITQWIWNEAIYKNLVRISGWKGSGLLTSNYTLSACRFLINKGSYMRVFAVSHNMAGRYGEQQTNETNRIVDGRNGQIQIHDRIHIKPYRVPYVQGRTLRRVSGCSINSFEGRSAYSLGSL